MKTTGNDVPSGFVVSLSDNRGIIGSQTIGANATGLFENVPNHVRLDVDDCTDPDRGCFTPRPDHIHPKGRCGGGVLLGNLMVAEGTTTLVTVNIECLPWLGWVDIEITGSQPRPVGYYSAVVLVDVPVGYPMRYQTNRTDRKSVV